MYMILEMVPCFSPDIVLYSDTVLCSAMFFFFFFFLKKKVFLGGLFYTPTVVMVALVGSLSADTQNHWEQTKMWCFQVVPAADKLPIVRTGIHTPYPILHTHMHMNM
jgi:hypothetical protein